MKEQLRENDEAVSPVIGVMLMLVVTIIIAAVVSGFAGGLAGTTQKAPQLAMDVKIANTGYAANSYILFDVQGVSEPIPTKDLKISTYWSTRDGEAGGATVTAGKDNTDYSTYVYQSPIGFGKGVLGDQQQLTSGKYTPEQWFGNYTLVPGTTMKSSAGGYNKAAGGYGVETRYEYLPGTYRLGPDEDGVDGMMAILGKNWNALRPGDLVNFKITHVPSGKIVFDKSVGVEG